MHRIILCVATGLALTLPAATDAQAAKPVAVPCRGCTIVVTKTAELGREAGAERPTYGGIVRRRLDGSFLIAPTNVPGHVGRFSVVGKYLGAFGRAGRGPGEFSFFATVPMAIGPRDSVAIANVANSRIEIFSPSLQYARSMPFPQHVAGLLFLPGGVLLAAPNGRTPELDSATMVLLGPAPTARRPFLQQEEPLARNDRSGGVRYIAEGTDGTIWTAHVLSYALRQYRRDGTLLRRFDSPPDWFIATARPGFARPYQQVSFMAGIFQTGDGVLWVISRSPNLKAKALPDSPQVEAPSLAQVDDAVDTVIEAFDASSFKRLATLRQRGYMHVGNGFLYHYRESAGREGYFIVYTPALKAK